MSVAYSARVSCAYKIGRSFTRKEQERGARFINLGVVIYECESSGGEVARGAEALLYAYRGAVVGAVVCLYACRCSQLVVLVGCGMLVMRRRTSRSSPLTGVYSVCLLHDLFYWSMQLFPCA